MATAFIHTVEKLTVFRATRRGDGVIEGRCNVITRTFWKHECKRAGTLWRSNGAGSRHVAFAVLGLGTTSVGCRW